MTGLLYSERILRRHRLWWRETMPGVHAPRECFAALDRGAPDASWRCCPHWQRKLSNKWNSREFAARHGVPTPGLYWHGSDPDAAPWADLPDTYVTRPTVGHSTHGTQVMVAGEELLTRRRRAPAAVRRHMRDYLAAHDYEHLFYLLEETMRDEDPAVARPRGYRCHTYAGHVAVVQVNTYRLRWQRWRRRWKTFANLYTPDWRPLDVLIAPVRPPGPGSAAPRCLDAMLEAAARLGREYGSYVAIDFYATPDGPRLGEISPTPRRGAGYTPEAEALFGAPWNERCPDAL